MAQVVGVRFKPAGQIYFFDPAELKLDIGDRVVVETSRGLTMGHVVNAPREIAPGELSEPLKAVLRIAEPDDFKRVEEMKQKESTALTKCEELVAKHEIAMNPLSAEYSLDGSHLSIYFKSEKRVDFRSLLRELSSSLKTRVELRQVGARDAAKLIGGVGRCGLPLCCVTHLSKFEPISMKMAREQDLPLNPANISGVCGRLLCCLAYENEQYRLMKRELPARGEIINTQMGEAKIIGLNPLKETVMVQLESEAILEMSVSDIESQASDRPQ